MCEEAIKYLLKQSGSRTILEDEYWDWFSHQLKNVKSGKEIDITYYEKYLPPIINGAEKHKVSREYVNERFGGKFRRVGD